MTKLTKKQKKALFTKKGVLSKRVVSSLLNCRLENNRIYYNRYVGSRRRTQLASEEQSIRMILTVLKLKFKEDNTAPRGGKFGDCFIISTKAANKLMNIQHNNVQ